MIKNKIWYYIVLRRWAKYFKDAGTSVEDDGQLNLKSLKKSITRILSDILKKSTIRPLINGWRGIKNGGDYFEHLINPK